MSRVHTRALIHVQARHENVITLESCEVFSSSTYGIAKQFRVRFI